MTENKGPTPTVEQIITDRITQLANQYWAPSFVPNRQLSSFDPNVIETIYFQEIVQTKFSIRRVMMLEFSQYLENYLWPNYKANESSFAHLMSIVCMINEKFRERVPAWEALKKHSEYFPEFFHEVLKSCLSDDFHISLTERTALIVFLTHSFNSMEEEIVRNEIKKLVSLSMWKSLQLARREYELRKTTEWNKMWNRIMKRDSKLDVEKLEKLDWDRKFLHRLMLKFLIVLENLPEQGVVEPEKIHYCERFLELLIDLETSLPTRRFFNTVLDDCHLVVRCSLSALPKRSDGNLFLKLLEMLKFYSNFEINEVSGDPLSDHDMMQLYYSRMTSLKKVAFNKFPKLKKFALLPVASISTRKALQEYFKLLNEDELQEMAVYLNYLPKKERRETENWFRYDYPFLLELLISKHEKRPSHLEELNSMPLYPTEDIIWNENIVPTEYFSGDSCLALPKLNLQFLTLHDYLLRNFNLFRLESTYEIRQDIEYSLIRLTPWKSEDGGVYFGTRTRMAQPIVNFTIVEVLKPNLGEKSPARVRADVTVNLNLSPSSKAEWEELRRHDVCFLITARPILPIGTPLTYNNNKAFMEETGLTYVRGCEIEGMLDQNGKIIEEGPDPKPVLPGDTRTYRVFLDQNQYRIDMDSVNEGNQVLTPTSRDVHETFNVILRRKPKENNFKAVLETIRTLMNTECVVPDWIQDILLGYGDPSSAHYSNLSNQIETLDFNDTFLNMDHLRNSFPNYEIEVNVDDPKKLVPPFKVTFKEVTLKRKLADNEPVDKVPNKKAIIVEPYTVPSRGPYHFNEPKKNAVPFTPTQIEAIRSGMQPGLTIVVGPPGTGKTDVAVQIISNLYHNFPNQRILIVTHSNQALNQLFEKIIMLDVDERHLLRLGHGEEALETEKDFSRYGRVNYVLAKRLELLNDVKRLQHSLNIPGEDTHTCETAGYFFSYHILSRWEKFCDIVKPKSGKIIPIDAIEQQFPFHGFFVDAIQPLFKKKSYEEDLEIAEGCFRYLQKIFTQLEEFRSFESIRTGLVRSEYLLVKEAKIVAMTCTHAALKRQDLVDLRFKYDSILMEEAAQILEIETFIPLLLQNPENNYQRLKRWIMIGDHHQLPPVIKNMAFQKYSNMEQSLFTRMVRLGVPTIDLDRQGRARPSICNLYNWRYKNLGNLKHVENMLEYQLANAGFAFDYQLINVEDYNGVGETEPRPFFYQNLAEAEYCASLFIYMRLMGYPSYKITILTTYNGQKQMLRDIIQKRCASNPLLGMPQKITTVDKYQGSQNDFIILSLVRTKAVGHLRDIRRLVVAMSRARLGLYIFARISLFKNCFEITPAFYQLMKRPIKLCIHPEEKYPSQRMVNIPFQIPPRIFDDMPQFAGYVHELLKIQLESLQPQLTETRKFYKNSTTINSTNEDDVNKSNEKKEVSSETKEKKMIYEPIVDELIDEENYQDKDQNSTVPSEEKMVTETVDTDEVRPDDDKMQE